MKLIVICVVGAGSTGKSTTIREFTATHLKYEKSKGDVLGVFEMPRMGYAVGVAGGGDTPGVIKKGQKFLTRYEGLRVMIVACHKQGKTIQEVNRIVKNENATVHWICTNKLPLARRKHERAMNVEQMRRYMPHRAP